MATNDLGDDKAKAQIGAARALSASIDAVVFLAVLICSALAVIVIAFAAPLAIAVSAIAGAVSPQHRPRRWRGAHVG